MDFLGERKKEREERKERRVEGRKKEKKRKSVVFALGYRIQKKFKMGKEVEAELQLLSPM